MTDQNFDMESKLNAKLEGRKKLYLYRLVGFLLILFLLSFLLFRWGRPKFSREIDMPTVYVKDKSIYIGDRDKSVKIVEQIYREAEEEHRVENVNLEGFIHMTRDGSGVYFFQNIYEDDGIYIGDLFYKDLRVYNYEKYPSVELGKDIVCGSLVVSSNEKYLLYLKNYNGEIGDLYLDRLVDRSKLSYCATDKFRFSKDSEKIIYKAYENDSNIFWLVDISRCTQEKLDDDIDEIVYVDSDFDSIYYSKLAGDREFPQYNLYRRNEDKSVDKVLGDISDVYSILESGELLYERTYLESIPLGEIVKCPKEKRVSRSGLNSECMFIRYKEDSYSTSNDRKKSCPIEEDVRLKRFIMVEKYEENPVKILKKDLYRLDKDGNEEKILEGVNQIAAASLEKGKVLYSKFQGLDERIDIDELSCAQDIKDYFYKNYEVSNLLLYDEYYREILISERANRIYNMVVNNDWTELYIVYEGNNDDKLYHELYQYTIDGEIKKKIIDEKVDLVELLEDDSNLIAYYKYEDDEDLSSDLYLYSEGKKAKVGDSIVHYDYDKETGILMFMENMDIKTGLGDLVLVKDFNKTYIDNNVSSYYYKKILNTVYYFKGDGLEDSCGDLWKADLRGGIKRTQINCDVESLLSY